MRGSSAHPFLRCSDEAYTADQVLDMERKMLHTLGWELAAVPTVTFVENVIVDLELPAPDER